MEYITYSLSLGFVYNIIVVCVKVIAQRRAAAGETRFERYFFETLASFAGKILLIILGYTFKHGFKYNTLGTAI